MDRRAQMLKKTIPVCIEKKEVDRLERPMIPIKTVSRSRKEIVSFVRSTPPPRKSMDARNRASNRSNARALNRRDTRATRAIYAILQRPPRPRARNVEGLAAIPSAQKKAWRPERPPSDRLSIVRRATYQPQLLHLHPHTYTSTSTAEN